MEKTPRYTQRERNMVLSFAAQYKDVIENKRTDAESNRKKDDVWSSIAKEFNSRAYHQRSSKQLRQLYKNMKLLLKKDLGTETKGSTSSSRSFMDILSALSHQDSINQYIAGVDMLPEDLNNRSLSKTGDDYESDPKVGTIHWFLIFMNFIFLYSLPCISVFTFALYSFVINVKHIRNF